MSRGRKASPRSPRASKLLLLALKPAGTLWKAAPRSTGASSPAPMVSLHAVVADSAASASSILVEPDMLLSDEGPDLRAPERSALEDFVARTLRAQRTLTWP